MLRVAILTLIAAALPLPPVQAQTWNRAYRTPSGRPVPGRFVHGTPPQPLRVAQGRPSASPTIAGNAAPVSAPVTFQGYPQLNAGMYPSPRPGVPYQVGGTMITNPAFAPHEMLHRHKYKAMYGPFYYKVKGFWHVTPFGVWSHDHWKLQGTEVEVKYHTKFGLFNGFTPPRIR